MLNLFECEATSSSIFPYNWELFVVISGIIVSPHLGITNHVNFNQPLRGIGHDQKGILHFKTRPGISSSWRT
jgi:hypothetical protein